MRIAYNVFLHFFCIFISSAALTFPDTSEIIFKANKFASILEKDKLWLNNDKIVWGSLDRLLASSKELSCTNNGSVAMRMLEALKNAIAYIRRSELTKIQSSQISSLYSLSLNHRLMGNFETALAVLAALRNICDHSFDIASAVYMQGECLFEAGYIKESIQLYNEALKIQPHRIKIYISKVKALLKQNQYTTNDWLLLLKEIRTKMKILENGGYDMIYYNDSYSFLYKPSLPDSNIYLTMFEVADKAGKYNLAWSYLQKARRVDRDVAEMLNNEKGFQTTGLMAMYHSHKSSTVKRNPLVTTPLLVVATMWSVSSLLRSVMDYKRLS